MPKRRTTRDRFKRKLDQIDDQYEHIINVLSEMFQVYHESNPDLTLQLAILMEAISELQKATKSFRNSF